VASHASLDILPVDQTLTVQRISTVPWVK
jgi:hypothetical protein